MGFLPNSFRPDLATVGTGHLFLGQVKFHRAGKKKMFGITPDRHTWMLELSYEPFVNGSPMYVEYGAVAEPLRHYQ